MSKLEDYEWMIQYLKTLDSTNARILEGLGKHGPRNVYALAQSIGLPSTTVAYRMKRLVEEGLLQVRANLNYRKLGLIRGLLIAESLPGQMSKTQKAINNLEYWTYVTRCYGKYDGYYALVAFPEEYRKELEEYLEQAARLKAFSSYIFHPTTSFVEVPPNFNWFNFQDRSWIFHWEHWIDEIQNAPEELPEILKDSKRYTIQVDKIDILILKEFEKDGTIKFTELAKLTELTPQAIRYRYNEHVLRRNLLTDFEVATLPYPLPTSNMCSFIIEFDNEKKLAKFSATLSSKPFVFTYGKVINRHSLVVHTYVPKTELSKLIESMNMLTQKKVIKDFLYVILDVASFNRQTISYEYFKKNKWTYDQKEKLDGLKRIAGQ